MLLFFQFSKPSTFPSFGKKHLLVILFKSQHCLEKVFVRKKLSTDWAEICVNPFCNNGLICRDKRNEDNYFAIYVGSKRAKIDWRWHFLPDLLVFILFYGDHCCWQKGTLCRRFEGILSIFFILNLFLLPISFLFMWRLCDKGECMKETARRRITVTSSWNKILTDHLGNEGLTPPAPPILST